MMTREQSLTVWAREYGVETMGWGSTKVTILVCAARHLANTTNGPLNERAMDKAVAMMEEALTYRAGECPGWIPKHISDACFFCG